HAIIQPIRVVARPGVRPQGGWYRVDGYRQARREENRHRFTHPTAMARHRTRPIMKTLRIVFRLGLLIGFGNELSALPTTAQTTSPKEAQTSAVSLRKLTGDDAKRAAELDQAIEAALKADRWDEAIARAEELLALRARAQGPKHFETVTAQWDLK